MPRWWTRIGGPNAITIWSWWITLPLAILISITGARQIGMPLLPWIALVVGVQVVLIAPLLLIRATYLSARPRPSRPLIALVTFAVLGALRQALLALAAWAGGAEAAADLIVPWSVTGAIYGAVALSVIAIVVDSSREHADTTQRLSDLQASLDAVTVLESEQLAELEADFLAEAEGSVMAALAEVRRTDAESASRSLREVAEVVVRPLSHRLADDQTWSPPPVTAPVATRRWGSVMGQMRPVAPLGPVLLLEGAGLPFMLTRVGVIEAVVNLVVGGTALYLATALISRRWPQPRGPVRRVLSLALAYVLCAALACALVFACFAALGWNASFLVVVVVIYPLLALALSAASAIEAQRRDIEDDMAGLVVRQAQVVDRLRVRVAAARRRIANALHSSVQAEIIASALSLARTGDTGAAQEEIDRLADRVSAALHPPAADARLRERLDELSLLWEGVLDVRIEAADDLWSALDADPSTQAAVVDVVAEALTNAVRHGRSAWARVSLTLTRTILVVEVVSGGRLGAAPRPGLGSRTIAEASSRWSLEDSGDGVRLRVEFDRSTAVPIGG
jgi:signal transduction histidine kinase